MESVNVPSVAIWAPLLPAPKPRFVCHGSSMTHGPMMVRQTLWMALSSEFFPNSDHNHGSRVVDCARNVQYILRKNHQLS
jgi:hypothetical protein